MNSSYILKLFLFLFTFGLQQAFCQANYAQSQPVGDVFRSQIDSMKQVLATQGYKVVREAPMNMESEYETPVIVPLSERTWYQFVFIGEPDSKLYEVRMYDANDQQVIYQKHQWGEIDGNIISYPYIPQLSGLHMIKPVQVNKKKKKNLFGYIMIFKKVA